MLQQKAKKVHQQQQEQSKTIVGGRIADILGVAGE